MLNNDSSEGPVFGDKEGSTWNRHFRLSWLRPLFVFSRFGSLDRYSLRPDNAQSAAGWAGILCPALARYSAEARLSTKRKRIQAAAAFVSPYNLLEAEGWDYSIRIKGNPTFFCKRIVWPPRAPPNRPPSCIIRDYPGFQWRPKVCSTSRRVVSKAKLHPGELFSRIGFIVYDQRQPNDRMVVEYTKEHSAPCRGPGCPTCVVQLPSSCFVYSPSTFRISSARWLRLKRSTGGHSPTFTTGWARLAPGSRAIATVLSIRCLTRRSPRASSLTFSVSPLDRIGRLPRLFPHEGRFP